MILCGWETCVWALKFVFFRAEIAISRFCLPKIQSLLCTCYLCEQGFYKQEECNFLEWISLWLELPWSLSFRRSVVNDTDYFVLINGQFFCVWYSSLLPLEYSRVSVIKKVSRVLCEQLCHCCTAIVKLRHILVLSSEQAGIEKFQDILRSRTMLSAAGVNPDTKTEPNVYPPF